MIERSESILIHGLPIDPWFAEWFAGRHVYDNRNWIGRRRLVFRVSLPGTKGHGLGANNFAVGGLAVFQLLGLTYA